ncbi:undecaprenyl-phosphate glucose phosphotransferase [Glaciimonas immobilis]|uniref:Putative colanic acid biosynthesis UDP-glucose lipid carrier transferase n=1 Tax=Glaciimonas immobilis TaxID=728004 RepID=A0A840RQ86_9BURK|nr:undecaprenyl-phosphate glucose phosphotransferase [Glaciimonas immobilis]KAF3998016.1 undecaprenyl-phosphate glucose phosphotransferase [Glaciimonas immobilis]MBB5199302.1 putative colanic acid biosynthesis UDP-glucose lipid carrier transferase [Glaciimonas immobilis]
MTENDIPMVSFFKRMLDPMIILGLLYLIIGLKGELFTGSYLLLLILAFFISSYTYDRIDNYRTQHPGGRRAYAGDIFLGWAVIVFMLMLIGEATELRHEFSASVILIWITLTPFALLLSRFAAYDLVFNTRKEHAIRSAVIIGSNDPGFDVLRRLQSPRNPGVEVRGYFDDRDQSARPAGLNCAYLGALEDVGAYVGLHKIKTIFICFPMSPNPRILTLLDVLRDTTASVYFIPDTYTFDLMGARLAHVGGIPVIGVCETPFMGGNGLVKRGSDIVLALLIQIMLLPIMLFIAIGIKLTSAGPIIFAQRRYGLNGEEIVVYKFRSMAVCEDGPVIAQAKKNDARVTRLGAFLRRTSLDELPQFINVLQGRMSIVGPRPHAVAHNEMYRKLIKGYMLRHKVKPGITGWAQVNGLRGETDTIEKMRLRIQFDLEYLKNWSLAFDLLIIARTVKEVLKKGSAY